MEVQTVSRNTLLWLHGLGSGFIGGGSGAVSSAFGVNLIDPKDWNLASWHSARHMLLLMGITFMINGVLTAFAWLSKNPVPEIAQTPATPPSSGG